MRALALALLLRLASRRMLVAEAATGDGPGDLILAASAARTASGASDDTGEIGPFNSRRATGLTIQLDVTADANPGTLDVWVQTTVDDGTEWDDIAHFTQMGGTGTRYVNISTIAAGGTTDHAKGDAAMAANTVRQGPIGSRLRAKWTIAGAGASFTFSVKGVANGVG